MPTLPACSVPAGFLTGDMHCSPPALDVCLSMCAQSHTETFQFPGHFTLTYALKAFFTDALFMLLVSLPLIHSCFFSLWALSSLIVCFSWLFYLLVSCHSSSWDMVESVRVVNIQFYALFSFPHSMLLLTYPLNLKKFSVLLS